MVRHDRSYICSLILKSFLLCSGLVLTLVVIFFCLCSGIVCKTSLFLVSGVGRQFSVGAVLGYISLSFFCLCSDIVCKTSLFLVSGVGWQFSVGAVLEYSSLENHQPPSSQEKFYHFTNTARKANPLNKHYACGTIFIQGSLR